MTSAKINSQSLPAILALFFLVLFSHVPVSADDNAMIASYAAVWKTALAAASGITEKELEPLIEVKTTGIQSWNSGKAFQVTYAIKTGWLTTERRDNFVVWLNSSESAYRHLPLRRDVWFTLPEIKIVLEKRVFDTTLGKVDPSAKLMYANLDEAKAFLMNKYNLKKIDSAEVAFYVPGKLPREDGMPYLLWSTVLDDGANKLRKGYLNLVNGTDESYEDAIRIYGSPSAPEGAGSDDLGPVPADIKGRGIVPGN